MKKGIVTLEFQAGNTSDSDAVTSAQRTVRTSVVKLLNRLAMSTEQTLLVTAVGSSTGLRRRRRDDGRSGGGPENYTEDTVRLVSVDPPVKDQTLRVSVVAQNKQGEVLAAETLKNELWDNKDELSTDVGLVLKSVYVGLPSDVQPAITTHRRQSVWEQHFWMFMAVLILLAVALLTLFFCCLCFRCHCRRAKSGQKEQSTPNKQVPVEEMVELAPVAPLQSAPPPMYDGPADVPPTSEEENGWIIPIDQLTQEELEQPEVQISRL
jgi:hypothetical protein